MDLALLRRPIEQRIAAATGLHTTLGRIDVSAFGASIEIGDVTLTAPDAAADDPPLLSIRRVKAELSLRKAMRGELRIKSLVIERPIVSLRRDPSGRLNFPTRPPRHESIEPASPPAARGDGANRGLSVVADRALLVAGEVHYRDEAHAAPDAPAYHAAAVGIDAELTRETDGYALSLRAASLARLDLSVSASPAPADLGPSRLSASLRGVTDLAAAAEASLQLTLLVGDEAAPSLRLTADAARLAALAARFALDAALDAAQLALLLPAGLPSRLRGLSGSANLRIHGSAAASPRSLRLDELTLTARDLAL